MVLCNITGVHIKIRARGIYKDLTQQERDALRKLIGNSVLLMGDSYSYYNNGRMNTCHTDAEIDTFLEENEKIEHAVKKISDRVNYLRAMILEAREK